MKLAALMSIIFLCMSNEIISLCVLSLWVFWFAGKLIWEAGEHGY